MSLDQNPMRFADDGAASGRPTMADAVASALGSVRAEGLEPDAAGLALLDAVAACELRGDEAIERAMALYTA